MPEAATRVRTPTSRGCGTGLIERIELKGGQVVGVALKQPFEGLFLLASSDKGTLVWGDGTGGALLQIEARFFGEYSVGRQIGGAALDGAQHGAAVVEPRTDLAANCPAID